MADFLIALADFDRRRGWEALGHASLFAFLHVELKLPGSSSFWRMSAARLLQRFPDLAEPMRDGRLCLTTAADLARVLTEENRADVLPRFYGASSRETKELLAELQPREAPATRAVVTSLSPPVLTLAPPQAGPELGLPDGAPAAPAVVPQTQLRADEVAFGGGERPHTPRDETEPLTANLRRLHITVSRQLLKKLEAAQAGLGHAISGATMEQVIDAAVDLLLEKQARARALVKRPRAVLPRATPIPSAGDAVGESRQGDDGMAPAARPEGRAIRRDGHREAIPAAVKRAVWERDQGRCSWPIDGGGVCGSTHRLELDHIVPWAEWGGETEGNLRVVCRAHNRLAARQAFGERVMGTYFASTRHARTAGRPISTPSPGAFRRPP
jgi:hypothetical protein